MEKEEILAKAQGENKGKDVADIEEEALTQLTSSVYA